jgi:bifunctional non-homologous end joining protein LigD
MAKRTFCPGRPLLRIAQTLEGAKAAPYPGFVPFYNPSLKAKVPISAGWLYEIKFDGYRCQLHLNAGKAKAYSRNGNGLTRDFAPICDAAEQIAATTMIIDGEVVVPDADGRPNFSALRAAIGEDPDRLLFYAFDLLYLDGLDIRGVSLIERRSISFGSMNDLAEMVDATVPKPGKRGP